jgi:N-acyl-D-amino-acid deacylase
VGIPYVLIDGRFVIDDGSRTDVLAGRSVRRTPRGDAD